MEVHPAYMCMHGPPSTVQHAVSCWTTQDESPTTSCAWCQVMDLLERNNYYDMHRYTATDADEAAEAAVKQSVSNPKLAFQVKIILAGFTIDGAWAARAKLLCSARTHFVHAEMPHTTTCGICGHNVMHTPLAGV